MIYPSETGKAGEIIRLRTLESIWIQGKLRMWGRWSYIGSGKPDNMFNRLLAGNKVTRTAVRKALRDLKRSGLNSDELAIYLSDLLNGKLKSGLAFCSDAEALIIDHVVGQQLPPAMIALLHERYDGYGRSKKSMARALNIQYPEWSFRTCESRIDVWLTIAESLLYRPMCDAFDTDSERFGLHSCAETV
ncbi:putative bacteriophage protein [Shimwellia blattae DSM 4481 = NBRC 105725]|uniref:Putative bacteriophage protein n=1 Tax=Shimwellia blattae (strain ATCC 29907 / DSM 4481 / JCM 1650 / NBRC 105725 / CDC 9005-74) TaxID=630626 RepID=I2B9G4_SHIBC|nr:DUF1133 family protein [Shimwellia blattae]AFJ47168.1 putative bacteriophage protein [Shimwellia blattae DSM 4481 = NBRC 105725]GAB82300.1 hypothetical protein EB105725_21_00970 [Shimwellia blattae DSM 4481 = NBRC 105725]VEC22765.1 Protein of uncharacterised function (DUF1133) [Shimwellia blattae]